MKRLRVAGIGAGYLSRFHVQGWRAVPEANLVGWCDRDVSRVRELPAYGSLGELLDKARPDPRRTMGEMWLEGERGVLRLDGEARLWWKPHGEEEQEHAYDRGPAGAFGGGACGALQRHVVDFLLKNGPLENAGRDYLANLRIVEAVYRSSTEGRRLTLPQPFKEVLP